MESITDSTQEKETESESVTRSAETGCGTLYVTIAKYKNGNIKKVFAHIGKNGGCVFSFLDKLSEMSKILIRKGEDPYIIVKMLKGTTCHNMRDEESRSCMDVFGRILEKELKEIERGK